MSQQSGGVSSAFKKYLVLAVLVVAVSALVLFAITKQGPRETRIIGEGDQAPEFRLSTLDGKQIHLSDFRGKVVILHFWATWCPPCVEELPVLDRFSRSMSGADIQFLAVSVDEGGAEAVAPFMKKNALTIPVLLDPGASVSHSYGTFKFPETYLLDRNGVVRYKVIGPADWSDPANIQGVRDMIAQR